MCRGGGSTNREDEEALSNPLLANECQQASPENLTDLEKPAVCRECYQVQVAELDFKEEERIVATAPPHPKVFLYTPLRLKLNVNSFSAVNPPTLSSTRAAASTIGQGRDQARSLNSSKLRDCSWRASGVTFLFNSLEKFLKIFELLS